MITLAAAQTVIDQKTKPVGSLGELERWAARLCVARDSLTPCVDRARIVVFGADHGVAAERVSAYPAQVTAEMMKNYGRGGAAINAIANASGIGLEVIDVGVEANLWEVPGVIHAKVRRGTENIVVRDAMTPEELRLALEVGASAARRAVADGIDVLGLGEMGIGNTTTTAAMLGALAGLDPAGLVGRGTGIGDATLERKRVVVRRAVERHRTMHGEASPETVLRSLGGLEIAAIAGAAIEAAFRGLVVVADGFISTAGVAVAVRMCPTIQPSIFVAHRSTEPGHIAALSLLGIEPMIDLEMRLGEGSGAAVAIPLLRAAAAVMRMATFEAAAVSRAIAKA